MKLEECLEVLTEGEKRPKTWLPSAWEWAVRISQANRDRGKSEEQESSRCALLIGRLLCRGGQGWLFPHKEALRCTHDLQA